MDGEFLTIRKKLYNNEKTNIYIKFKKYDEDDINNAMKQNYYGFHKNYAGQMGKFVVKINKDWTVLDIKNDLFTRTNKDEYTWGGMIPPEGCDALFKLCKKTGTYEIEVINSIKNLNPNENVKEIKYKFPLQFYGGNINIISMKNKCDLTDDIKVNEKRYELVVKNKTFSELNFITQCTIQNRTSGQWNVDLTEEQIKTENDDYIKNEKEQLKKIANKILKNDKSNKPDYIKICKWVNENVKYNLSFSGKKLSPLEIFKIKTGVCDHFTKLFNALLYSIGYLTIYVSGYAIKETFPVIDSSGAHAWSLIKIGDKWIPFDCTWGIWSGKIPITHIFSGYFDQSKSWTTHGENVEFNDVIKGKFIK
jgi:hypothetical protein